MCRFPKTSSRVRRVGLTLLELLIASAIMAIMAGVLGALALSVQMQSEHSQGHGEAVQHARVVIDRLQRLLNEATANDQFPGYYVQTDVVGAHSFPETIAIWHPATTAANPSGLPRWNEIVVICPDRTSPNILVELTDPTNTNTVPAITDTSAWRTALLAMKQSNSVEKIELTPLLRVASVTSNLGQTSTQTRGAVRFNLRLRPDDAQWTAYKAGTLHWDELPWVQGIYGTKSGLRQSWCRIELQLVPGLDASIEDPTGQNALTFFGSAAVYYEMHQ